MPELPEVETTKRDLEKKLKGVSIRRVIVNDPRIIRPHLADSFSSRLTDQKISAVTRRGKAIIITFASKNRYLIVQLMMTGQLIYTKNPAAQRFTRVTLVLSNDQHLHYNDQRLFGRLQIVDEVSAVPYFKNLGPEPLMDNFQIPWLKQALKKRSGPIKTLLMNHHFLAGIGNIYASEILFACGIGPKRRAWSLKEKEIAALHKATVDVLNEAVEYRGTSMQSYRDSSGKEGNFMKRIKVYGREGEPCVRCRKSTIKKIVLSGRSTFFCAECQH